MLPVFVNSASAADPCDRKCLEGYIDKVLAAMIAHNPGQLMFAKDVRYTENGVELIPGDGMWGTLNSRGKYNLYVCDTKAGQAGFYGTVSENGRRLIESNCAGQKEDHRDRIQ